MIRVGKSEIDFLRENNREVEYVRTCVQDSKRHNYWVAETRLTVALLKEYWQSKIVEHLEK